MSVEVESQSTSKDTGRVEAFSDGVFSIALTLLVLELKVPPIRDVNTARALWAELGQQWPSYFAFLTSFATVLIMWVNHHGIFRLVHRTSAPLLFVNGFLLLLVTAVPFPTALVATYLRTPAASVGCCVYSALFVVISLAYGMLLLVVSRNGHVLAKSAMFEIKQRTRDCFVVGFPCYATALIAAPFSPWISLGICTALWLFWSFRHSHGTGFEP